MIVASILLIVVAVVLLVAGLAGGSSPLLITSIAASVLAAVALVAGARQAAATRATTGRPHERTGPGDSGYGPPPGEPEIPVQHTPSTVGTGTSGWRQPPEAPEPAYSPRESALDDAGLASDAPAPTSPAAGGGFDGEPPAQPLSPAQAARLAEVFADVQVVDGHPRFHLPDCPHLIGRDDEPLPVGEAVQLGFTPCADCAPATALLPDPPRDRSW
ncbi:hypothetical protein ACIBPB_09045 [Micromonospora sp. NPDC049836]|uniref:hypothetical protein n=1 Tax=Micromonospora sp. NPDC049836 TaxID=3364274 RepID=UPI00378B62DC